MTVVGTISQVNCTATACSLTRDSVARDSGGHHIEHLHRVNAGHLLLARQGYGSPRHAPGPVNLNLLVSNKLHLTCISGAYYPTSSVQRCDHFTPAAPGKTTEIMHGYSAQTTYLSWQVMLVPL